MRKYLMIWFAVVMLCSATVGSAADIGGGKCFDCHEKKNFQGHFQHRPVSQGACRECHQTHAARHEKLLRLGGRKLCAPCHEKLIKVIDSAARPHEPAKSGQCSQCHQPHAAEFRHLLKQKPGSECFSCHENEAKQEYKYRHRPFAENNCYACHDPHGSDQAGILKRAAPGICFQCHPPGAGLSRSHLGRDLKNSNCLSCHHPHGSQKPEMTRELSHQPFAKGECRSCHQANERPAQANCLNCHPQIISGFLKPHNHLGANRGRDFCLDCHDPHTADRANLPAGLPGESCRNCHQDKFARREKMLYRHADNDVCDNCHQLHGSDRATMLKQEAAELCTSCHKRHKEFSHPLGDEALDPRNREAMNCITCHDPCNGTIHEYNLRGDARRSLCVQCHLAY